MYKKIMVLLDGSRAGGKAVDHAEELAEKLGGELILFRVVPPANIPAVGMGMPGSISMYEMAAEAADIENQIGVKRARNQLNTRRRQLEEKGIKARAEVLTGDPATMIKKFAKSEKVDLIVMATRGRRGIKRALLGSVADDIVRSDVAPVLLLRR
ncbi:MAG: universal stress protein [Chloroflexi bacterium]|nr:universal stress protein [Chloroflexota bacterium]MDA1297750.1 universal stress protein [Chloroflexota bacterium]